MVIPLDHQQLYVQRDIEAICRDSIAHRTPITITGLTINGKIRTYTGEVLSIEDGHALHRGYPLRVTIVAPEPRD